MIEKPVSLLLITNPAKNSALSAPRNPEKRLR